MLKSTEYLLDKRSENRSNKKKPFVMMKESNKRLPRYFTTGLQRIKGANGNLPTLLKQTTLNHWEHTLRKANSYTNVQGEKNPMACCSLCSINLPMIRTQILFYSD